MQIDVELPAGFRGIVAKQAGRVGLVDGGLKAARLIHELAAYVDVGGMRTHGETGHDTAFEKLVRLVTDDVAVLACAGFGFVGIDDQIMRTRAYLLRHEGPFQPGRKAGTAAPAKAGGLDPLDDLVMAKLQELCRVLPVATLARAGKTGVHPAIEIGEDAILVSQHSVLPIPPASVREASWRRHPPRTRTVR